MAQAVAVVGSIAKQDMAVLHRVEHVGRRTSVMGLALGEFQPDRASFNIDKRVDLGRQAAARTAHGSRANAIGPREPENGSLGFF